MHRSTIITADLEMSDEISSLSAAGGRSGGVDACGRSMAPYEFWNKIGCPKKIVAPMVDHCDLPYRMQTREYGADLVYTQMFNATSVRSSPSNPAVYCYNTRLLLSTIMFYASVHFKTIFI